jgi:NADH dehydrogenase
LRFEPGYLDDVFADADAFVNTYWIRFPYRGVGFEDAVEQTRALMAAARRCKTSKFVQVSVSNASLASPLGYYRGKAEVERDLRDSGLSYGIVRPTLVVGPNDVLTNNMAWFLRRSPLVAVPWGNGFYLQPVTLSETGRIIADVVEAPDTREVDAAGPEVFTFREYLDHVARSVGRAPRFVPMPQSLMLGALGIAGRMLHDVVLTREELRGLQRNMLTSNDPPLSEERVSTWLADHGAAFGTKYVNDTVHRFRA